MGPRKEPGSAHTLGPGEPPLQPPCKVLGGPSPRTQLSPSWSPAPQKLGADERLLFPAITFWRILLHSNQSLIQPFVVLLLPRLRLWFQVHPLRIHPVIVDAGLHVLWLCNLEQATGFLWSSVSLSIKWVNTCKCLEHT